MRLRLGSAATVLLFASALFAAQGVVVRAMEGTVKKVDAATQTVVVKTADGTEHTLRFVSRTSVHGGQEIGRSAKGTFHGLKEGSEVVVHYTTRGTEDTAEEIDHIGKGGLKATDGLLTRMDRSAKTMTVKTADGAEATFRLTDRAATDAGQDIGKGAEKTGKVTVYYTEEAGHKIAHFFEKVF
jgi:hypothetical protein